MIKTILKNPYISSSIDVIGFSFLLYLASIPVKLIAPNKDNKEKK